MFIWGSSFAPIVVTPSALAAEARSPKGKTMSKDEWYEKLREWARDDARLGKLPFALMTPLAEHLANYEAAEQSAQSDDKECTCLPEVPDLKNGVCSVCGHPRY